ncbi:hypothetical protein [Cellulomonas sp. GbtcB1]|uniref:hypothetical protein n=1 Tax=Cellulomonas sp. GbtcB1 TaxID=2824746 RepID=UPI001C311769|nr:hypothetical protein [Cellulomonas sp. GbtcB1]
MAQTDDPPGAFRTGSVIPFDLVVTRAGAGAAVAWTAVLALALVVDPLLVRRRQPGSTDPST